MHCRNKVVKIQYIKPEAAMATGASVIASTCPFCMTMLSDGVKNKEKKDEVKIKGLIKLIVERKGLLEYKYCFLNQGIKFYEL